MFHSFFFRVFSFSIPQALQDQSASLALKELERDVSSDVHRVVKDACSKHVDLDGMQKVPIHVAESIQKAFNGLLEKCVIHLDELEAAIESSSSGSMEFLIDQDVLSDFEYGESDSQWERFRIERTHPVREPSGSFTPFDANSSPHIFSSNAWRLNSFGSQGHENYLRYKKQLKRSKLSAHAIKRDANNQFRAFAHQAYNSEDAHPIVRLLVMNEILRNPRVYTKFLEPRGIDVQEYVCEMSQEGCPGDHLTLCAMSNAYGSDICVFSPLFPNPLIIRSRNATSSQAYFLSYVNENHYLSLYDDDGSQEHALLTEENLQKMDTGQMSDEEDGEVEDLRNLLGPVVAPFSQPPPESLPVPDFADDMSIVTDSEAQKSVPFPPFTATLPDSTSRIPEMPDILKFPPPTSSALEEPDMKPIWSEKPQVEWNTQLDENRKKRSCLGSDIPAVVSYSATVPSLRHICVDRIVQYIHMLPVLDGAIPMELVQVRIHRIGFDSLSLTWKPRLLFSNDFPLTQTYYVQLLISCLSHAHSLY